jgi:hypothetical protein
VSAARRLRAVALAGALGAAVWASALGAPQTPPAEFDLSLLLIGDAGAPVANDPVLAALSRALAADPGRRLAVFLGDNVYPRGLPAESAPGRLEGERTLDAQIEAARRAGARAVFVPGNHDWELDGRRGWEAVRRQGAYIAARGGPGVTLLPKDGCPGPVVSDVGAVLRLVALDTHWWLHDGPRPVHPTSSCAADSEEEVQAALAEALATAGGRQVVVVGHHPLDSGGPHGGHFSWKDHLFPLRAWKSWLWLPLPGPGSAYPLARREGITDQDIPGAKYSRLRQALESVFALHPPRVYAAGHEHSLQVLRGRPVPYLVVSGAGSLDHTTSVAKLKGSLFAESSSGFVRLDLAGNSQARLSVFIVNARGEAREAFTHRLDTIP